MTYRTGQFEFVRRPKRRASRALFHAGLVFIFQGAVFLGGVFLGTCSTASAQGRGEIAIGSTVYAQSCANQNCHGDQGVAGRAPALAERGFKRDYVAQVTRKGIPETAMPGWEKQLPVEELEAVVSFVVSLQGVSEEEAEELDPNRPWLNHPGRALFFDAARVGACGSCHMFDGWGVPVTPEIQDPIPASVGDLRELAAAKVQTAHPMGEEPFPALPIEVSEEAVRLYDFSAKLPVLRSFAPGQVKLSDGATWKHSEALTIYTTQELTGILDFLRQATAD